LTAPVISNPQNLRLAVDTVVKRMFVRMFKSPFGHRRHYANAAHQQEGGSASPLSLHRSVFSTAPMDATDALTDRRPVICPRRPHRILIGPVRVCAGGGEQSPSLPRS